MDNAAQDQDSSYVSGCESGVSCNTNSAAAQLPYFDEGFIRLSEGDKVHDLIKQSFVSGLGSLGSETTILKNFHAGHMTQARSQSFQIYLQAWYPCSREEISKIFSYGFSHSINSGQNKGHHGSGVYFSPDNHPWESVKIAPIDKEGLQIGWGLEHGNEKAKDHDLGM